MRKVLGLIISCFAGFIYLMMISVFEYMKEAQELKYVEWDTKTITAAHYTVEIKFTKRMYDEFIEKYHDKESPLPEIT